MDRRLIAGLFGLVVSGCASNRQPESTVGPVGIEPVPPIYETINGGRASRSKALASGQASPQDQLSQRDAPRIAATETGVRQAPFVRLKPSAPAVAEVETPPAATRAAPAVATPPAPAVSTPAATVAAPAALSTEAELIVAPPLEKGADEPKGGARRPAAAPAFDPLLTGHPDAVPDVDLLTQPDPKSLKGAPARPADAVASAPSREAAKPARVEAKAASPPPKDTPKAAARAGVAAKDTPTSGAARAGVAAKDTPTSGAARSALHDPLLSDHPDAVPELDLPTVSEAPAAAAPRSEAPRAESKPSAKVESVKVDSAKVETPKAESTPARPAVEELKPSVDDDAPPLPESLDGPQAARARSARGAGRLAAGSGLKRDDAVGRVGFEVGGGSEGLRATSAEVKAAGVEPGELALEAAPLEALEIDETEAATRAAAATRKVEKPAESTAALLIPEHVDEHVLAQSAAHVGEDVITLRELRRAYKQRLLQVSGGRPESLSVRSKNELARQSLEDLVDRTLLIQEAKRLVKDEKKFDLVMKDADKYWRENELKSMLQRTHMGSESELASKLKSEGLSLEEVRDDFRAMFISRGFQRSRLESKLSAGMTEQYEYYEKHIHEFDEPARVTWREIEVVCGRHPDRAAARRKAEAVLERLRRNEDFETAARKYSEGPTRAAGGLWTTAPESYGEPAVRRELQTLPTRQISGIIEGATSFHIIRIDERRAAGPKPFHEVQDEVRAKLRELKFTAKNDAMLDQLRRGTVITSMFDASKAAGASLMSTDGRAGVEGRAEALSATK